MIFKKSRPTSPLAQSLQRFENLVRGPQHCPKSNDTNQKNTYPRRSYTIIAIASSRNDDATDGDEDRVSQLPPKKVPMNCSVSYILGTVLNQNIKFLPTYDHTSSYPGLGGLAPLTARDPRPNVLAQKTTYHPVVCYV